jgi:hypothetical protein
MNTLEQERGNLIEQNDEKVIIHALKVVEQNVPMQLTFACNLECIPNYPIF